MNDLDLSVEAYKQVLLMQSNNIEAIACLATSFYYSDKPEVALMLYRRIMQMGVSNPELFLNIGLCCFACQQYDFALSSIQRALANANEAIAADIWYDVGHIMMVRACPRASDKQLLSFRKPATKRRQRDASSWHFQVMASMGKASTI